MSEVTVMYWDNGHMDNGWGIAMLIGMLGILVLVAVAIVWIIRSTRTPAVPPTASTATSAAASVTGSAEQILAERLARGDIDPEEYKTRLDALAKRRAP